MEEMVKKFVAQVCRMINPDKKDTVLVFNESSMDLIAGTQGKQRRTVFQCGRNVRYKRISFDPSEHIVMEYRVGTKKPFLNGYDSYLYEIKVRGKSLYRAPDEPKQIEELV